MELTISRDSWLHFCFSAESTGNRPERERFHDTVSDNQTSRKKHGAAGVLFENSLQAKPTSGILCVFPILCNVPLLLEQIDMESRAAGNVEGAQEATE